MNIRIWTKNEPWDFEEVDEVEITTDKGIWMEQGKSKDHTIRVTEIKDEGKENE